MEKVKVNDTSLWPKERRKKDTAVNGKLDHLEFFRTPNGSFWDMDDEYFNRKGFDIRGGYYIHELEYIPGPNWLPDLCCYEDEQEIYEKIDLEKEDDNVFFGDEENPEELDDEIFRGDFECEGIDDGFNDAEFMKFMKDVQNGKSSDLLKGLGGIDNKALEEMMKGMQNMGLGAPNKSKGKKNKKSKKKKTAKKAEDDDWDTASDN